jgi:tyrosinase
MPKIFTSRQFSVGAGITNERYYRADLLLHGVDHSGATYEGRVFLNNPKADERTPTNLRSGYAGSFYIFGHGGCFGDEGHCDVEQRAPDDPRGPHHLVPTDAVVDITEALRGAMRKGSDLTVTVVPVIMSGNEQSDLEEPFKVGSLEIQAYHDPATEPDTRAAPARRRASSAPRRPSPPR